MKTSPNLVYISHALAEEPIAREIEKHLAPLRRSGLLEVWHLGHAVAGESVDTSRRSRLESANVFLLLLSPDFLASDEGAAEIDFAMEKHRAGESIAVPVLVRPCPWEHTPLASLQILPSDGRPISSRRNRDEVLTQIVNAVATILKFRTEEAAAAPEESPRQPPNEILSIDAIFSVSGEPGVTYVEPDQFSRLRTLLRSMGSGLIVEGPSGVGKTTIVQRALRELGITDAEWLRGQIEEERERLDERLRKGFSGHLIIDEFHRLGAARQARVADAMKVISDRSEKNQKITVIGINPVGDSLVGALPDLAGRFQVVRMGRQPDEKVDDLIRKGERAANIVFMRRHELIAAAGGSFFTAQQLCYEALLAAGIDGTAPSRKTIDVDFGRIVGEVLKNLKARYFGRIRTFACHDEHVPPRGATLALLWLLSKSEEGHVTLEDVHFRFHEQGVRDAVALLKRSYLARCFDDAPELRSLFFYNRAAGILSVEDPRLMFYLRHMSWTDFIEQTNHRNARIDAEGNLVFSRRAPSDRPKAEEATITLLHLSDLHFSQIAQATLWSGQLAEDLRELRCSRIDALVLSGDLTQVASSTEMEAARQFLLSLSTELKISPAQVVVVPGNHDLSWSASKASYTLARRSEVVGAPEPGRIIQHTPEILEIRDELAYRKRFETFAEFYRIVKGAPYAMEVEDQFDIHDFPSLNLLILGLNSSWEIDHHYRSRASIHPEALARSLTRIRQTEAHVGRLKVAVWHHPMSAQGEDRLKDQGVLEQLAKAGFRLVLHGHIHKAENNLFRYDMSAGGRRIDLVAAGTFGAPTQEWVPGYPAQYNLLRFYGQKLVVETRRREEPNGAWKPDARWLQGASKDPLPRYEIDL